LPLLLPNVKMQPHQINPEKLIKLSGAHVEIHLDVNNTTLQDASEIQKPYRFIWA
jgi:hypothetical protein